MELERVKANPIKDLIKPTEQAGGIRKNKEGKNNREGYGEELNEKKEGGEVTSGEVINEEEKRALTKEDGKGEIIDVINKGMTAEDDDEKGTIIDIKV
jgi:hypothetical protein